MVMQQQHHRNILAEQSIKPTKYGCSVVSSLLCYGKDSRVRKHISQECAVHEDKCELCLKRASAYAAEGNLDAMQSLFQQAEDHARQAGVYNQSFRDRVANIKDSISQERTLIYHEGQAKHCLERAEFYASEGNKDMVLRQLQKAKANAQKCGNFDHSFAQKEQYIHCILKSTETTFHQRKSDHCLLRAAHYADDSNREMTHYFLKEAMKHAKRGDCYDKIFKGKAGAIQKTLKAAKDSQHTCMSLGSSHTSTTSSKRSVDEIPLLDGDINATP